MFIHKKNILRYQLPPIFRFNAIFFIILANKFLKLFFSEIEMLLPKSIWKCKKHRISTTNAKKE